MYYYSFNQPFLFIPSCYSKEQLPAFSQYFTHSQSSFWTNIDYVFSKDNFASTENKVCCCLLFLGVPALALHHLYIFWYLHHILIISFSTTSFLSPFSTISAVAFRTLDIPLIVYRSTKYNG